MDLTEAEVRAGIRLTADAALLFFCLAFSASSLVSLWPGRASKWLLRNRRRLGLTVAAMMAVHLGLIVWLARGWPDHFAVPASTIAGGGVGYLFLTAMALTSTDRTARALGPRRWKLLHRSGMYWLFVVFATTFAPAVSRQPLYAIPTVLLGVTLLLRVAAWLRLHRRRSTRSRPAA